MFSFFQKKSNQLDAPLESYETIKKVTLVFLGIFSGISMFFVFATLRSGEFGFLLSNPLGLLFVMAIIGILYLLPALLACLLFKFGYNKLSLGIIAFSMVVVVVSWQFAYQNKTAFLIYSRLYFAFDSLGIPKIPQGTLIPKEEFFPPGVYNINTTPFYDKYYLRINYPTWELNVTGENTSLLARNLNVEYSFYLNSRCSDVVEVPHKGGKAYENADFQTVKCLNDATCVLFTNPPPREDLSRESAVFMDDNKGCLLLRARSFDEKMFTTAMLLKMVNSAEAQSV